MIEIASSTDIMEGGPGLLQRRTPRSPRLRARRRARHRSQRRPRRSVPVGPHPEAAVIETSRPFIASNAVAMLAPAATIALGLALCATGCGPDVAGSPSTAPAPTTLSATRHAAVTL